METIMVTEERYLADYIGKKDITRYTYWVSGRGVFPFDMLRYDDCYPADTISAGKLGHTDKRSICIQSDMPPTVGRWASFLWSVGIEKIYE
jgi:hypothetical protein